VRSLAIKHAGPFRVTARDDGTVLISPAPGWRLHRDVFARQALAEEIEAHLNAMYLKMSGVRTSRTTNEVA
jgi:hypothetical protein